MLTNAQEEPICVLTTAPTPLARTPVAATQAINLPETECIVMVC